MGHSPSRTRETALRRLIPPTAGWGRTDSKWNVFEEHGRNPMPTKMSMMTATCFAAMLAGLAPAAAQTRTTLDIYVVDVEGGNATLFVAPSGESVLIDTGNVAPEAARRDADRILAAARDARLTQIDHLIITHWHGDHFGGVAELAKRIPIRHFIDHGANVQPAPAADDFLAKVYPQLYANAKH